MIVLLKYKAVSDGKLQKNAWMNLTEVRALEFAKDVHIDIEEWITRNSLDEVQELNS
jgi:hypothetical protein